MPKKGPRVTNPAVAAEKKFAWPGYHANYRAESRRLRRKRQIPTSRQTQRADRTRREQAVERQKYFETQRRTAENRQNAAMSISEVRRQAVVREFMSNL